MASVETVSAALLRSVELNSSFIGRAAQARQRSFDRPLECRDRRGNRLTAQFLGLVGFGLGRRQFLALKHGVAEHDDGARHFADFVARMGCRDARRGVAGGQPFHASARPLSGPVMLRPISQLNPSPIATMAMPTAMMLLRVRPCDAVKAAMRGGSADWPRQ